MRDGLFQKKLRASLFNDDPSNEPYFGRIHLAGKIPLRKTSSQFVYLSYYTATKIPLMYSFSGNSAA